MTSQPQSASIPPMAMQSHLDPADGNQAAGSAASDALLRRVILWLGRGSFALLGVAGGLLWWRDGERLFTEGLISAIARCF
ncbi:MAG: hypothetical protein ACRCWO_01980 [Bosea sp. (in: a-proteobacteria)]